MYGPVPFGLLLPPTFPSAISSEESIAMFTPSSAARIGTFGTDKFKVRERPDATMLVIVERFARPAAPVFVSITLSRLAFASVASNVEPS